jgi:hypothetical protein
MVSNLDGTTKILKLNMLLKINGVTIKSRQTVFTTHGTIII